MLVTKIVFKANVIAVMNIYCFVSTIQTISVYYVYIQIGPKLLHQQMSRVHKSQKKMGESIPHKNNTVAGMKLISKGVLVEDR